jgi:hypothetical protein
MDATVKELRDNGATFESRRIPCSGKRKRSLHEKTGRALILW